MKPNDALLGVAVSSQQTTRTYTAFKIEHDSADPLPDVFTVEEEVEQDDGTVQLTDVPLAETDTTLEDYIGAGAVRDKDGADGAEFTRRVLVEDAATRDAVTTELDTLGVQYATEAYSLTPKQKQIVEREGATNGNQIQTALELKGSLFDRKLVTEQELAAINEQIEMLANRAPNVAKAANRIGYILTGDNRFEVPNVGVTLSVEDGQLVNDGTETETVTVSHTAPSDVEAVLLVDGTEFTVTLPAGSDYTQDVTTTKTAGSTIQVELVGLFEEPSAVTIEVTN